MGSMRSSDAYKLELQPDSQERKAGTTLDGESDEYYDEEDDNKDSPEDNSPDQADETQQVN